MLSGGIGLAGSSPLAFDQFADAVGCSQPPGSLRLACLRKLPASDISTYVNGPNSGTFGSLTIDKCVLLMFGHARVGHDVFRIYSTTMFEHPL